ncbi:Scytalone dehydratase [Aspergillus leporis]|jgi:scytalone dehydratase|uniref:Scytalone dehydratase n=1 Tax=Aspergillus leporis TaxID=41062 RepID=A0A5N5WN05_9EURO|nr:Scytalone dehydratase [Aspergillus leporis]
MSSPNPLISCQNLLYDWAESMDTKSWPQLQALFAPTLSIDYSAVGGGKVSAIPSKAFVDRISSPARLGNPEIQTQHLIGSCKWAIISDKRMSVTFQVRAAHRRAFAREGNKEGMVVQAIGHGVNTIEFKLVDAVWRIAGIMVEVRWMEGDFAAVFRSRL